MNIMSILGTIIINPIRLIFEFVFTFSFLIITKSYGLSIVALSLVLNILLLPLYKKADEIQATENELQNKMKPDIDFIKRTFSGDEQFMMLQTYYRQHNYKPIYALRSSISLLLQIPFFMAAYSFLTNLKSLSGASFGPIANLLKPDALLFGLNLLPIAMTVINIISCIVYTKGQPLKSKIQLYVMALVFLILLYNSPSGLTLYYLLNNIFSLIKNLFDKTKNKTRIISVIGIIVSLLSLSLLFSEGIGIKGKIILGVIALSAIIICVYLFRHNQLPNLDFSGFEIPKYSFLLCTVFLSLLTGLLIPSSVIGTSPEEFLSVTMFVHPRVYIINSFLLSFGFFVIWLNVFYLMANKNTKVIFNLFMWIFCVVGFVNYIFFNNNNLGNITNILVYDNLPTFTNIEYLTNIVVTLILAVALIVLMKYKPSLTTTILTVSILAISIMSTVNIVKINTGVADVLKRTESYSNNDQILPLSKDGKNVVVFMLDRAISSYFPLILEEKPELQKQYEGFTFYPNAISFGLTTNIGTPGLFGGYEYMPEEMNKRSNESLVDKQNEALKVMPKIFDKDGYEVVVTDPPYAGYTWVPDLSIYNDMPNVKAYITDGHYNWDGENYLKSLNRNLFCFGLTKVVPNILYGVLYNDGAYLSLDDKIGAFISWYNVLKHLDYMTYTTNTKGSFIMMQNAAPHEPMMLSVPEYDPFTGKRYVFDGNPIVKKSITGNTVELKYEYQINHYHVNMASMIQVGKWLDYLRKLGVYDNTKIIIVSDHGASIGTQPEMLIYDDDLTRYHAFLMVKDFGSQEFKIDDTFMTNADVAYLATKDVIENPINPFSKKPIKKMKKDGIKFNILSSTEWNTSVNNGNTFMEGRWYSVHDNCLEGDCWEITEDPNK